MIAVCAQIVLLMLLILSGAVMVRAIDVNDKLAAWKRRALVGLAIVITAVALSLPAFAMELPSDALRYRNTLEREAMATFGLSAPVARLAAQIHQESLWKHNAASAYAQGLAQFTPPTAKWLPSICPSVGPPDPWDPEWSIRAIVCYDNYLLNNAPQTDACNRWAFVLSDYNGGTAWRMREQQLAQAAGKSPSTWWDSVEIFRARALSAWRENRGYVRTILLALEPEYINQDWTGEAVCT
jgi:soluble lytic murein transglycosylase-like protein